ncbi:MAG: hypothetical protein KDB27_00860 [Planctomycetales bacterium]|nr:hypothetical protein [Planctomycetales bacterium]
MSRQKKQTRRNKNNRSRAIRALESLEDRQLMAGHTAADCIDFEDLTVGNTYVVGDSFVADNTGFQAKVTGRPFEWSNGVMFAGGQATVESGNSSGATGQDISVNNINLDFNFSAAPVNDLSMQFGEFGGNLNIAINGDFVNFEDFQDINGAVIGGTTISVVNGFGQDTGVLNVSGSVNQFLVGGQELWIDHICTGEDDVPQGRLDYGDAPDRPYPTLRANNGAAHIIDPEVYLGRGVDPELDGQPSINADGDDSSPAFAMDDEDGVRFLTPVVPGGTTRVEVIASTDGYLNAWIDFDRDGVWTNGTAENVFSAQPLNAGVNLLSFNVPADAKPGPNEATYSRWRFSTTHKLLNPDASIPDDQDGRIPNGEVEDHLVFIQDAPRAELDFGDAPERPYPTTLANGGAYHKINPDVFLGRGVDADPDGQPSPAAMKDDLDAAFDDEDGVNFLTPLVPGQVAQVEVIASTDGFLNAWVDFDRDGDWQPGTSDEIFFAQPLVAGSNILSFNVPADAKPGPNEPTFSRWRFSTTDRVLTPKEGSPTGATPDGEVEDHIVFIQEAPRAKLDFGDAPERPYPTTLANGGAYHEINPDVFLGRTVDAEPDGQPTPNADGDDLAFDDEDGVRFLTPLVPGQDARVEVIASTDGWLNAWIDFDRDGTWTPGSPEEIFLAQPLTPGVNILSFHVPADAKPGPNEPTVSRWRFSTTDRVLTPKEGSPTGATPDGEVEDHLAIIQDVPGEPDYDFGDHRDSYGTTLAANGARHIINPNVFLGQLIDAEPDGQPSPFAQRDDANTSDDEDGVRFRTAIVPGKVSVVDVLSSADAKLDAWADFNQNGVFEPNEQILTSVPVTAGLNSLRYKVPDNAVPAPTRPVNTRFRLSTQGGLAPTGPARDGEVEDYSVLNGDLNHDWTVGIADIDLLCGLINNGDMTGDLNNDGVVNHDDQSYLVHNIIGTHYGDANLDLVFDSSDLVQMFAAAEYEDGIANNSTWAEGDFNCDGEFDSGDLVAAFADGGYVGAAKPVVVPVPEEVASEISKDSDEPTTELDQPEDTRGREIVIRSMAIDELFGEDDQDRPKNHNASQDALDRVFAMI